MPAAAQGVCSAEVVLPCRELDATLAFFTDRLGFRIEAVFPADAPAVAVVAGFGLRVRLDRDATGAPGLLRLSCSDPAAAGGDRELQAPNGTRVQFVAAEPAIALPPLVPSLVVTRASAGTWQQGRAGMRYCDLIPGRQGGAFIASRIRIDAGGPVPDWVHFHRVHLQLIYCHRGQVRVVYEDQGPPFVLRPGDAVLQPPQIRHRVLECSPGLEVVELSSPAAHETLADHTLELPTAVACPERRFDGQRFVHHVAERACSRPWRHDGFSARDLGVGAATGGLAEASVVRGRVGAATPTAAHGGELYFGFVLAGAVTLRVEGRAAEKLAAGDAFVVPAGLRHALGDASADLEWLEVAVRARTRG